jgi:hypothetical protein
MNDTQVTLHDVAVRKKLTIGVVGSVEKYREAFKKAGCKVNGWASDIMEKMPIATEPQELDLAIVTVAKLGSTCLTRYYNVCCLAKERGYDRCPAEVGLALLLASTDQLTGECLTVATAASAVFDGHPYVFSITRLDGDLCLYAYLNNHDDEWSPGSVFVFVQRQQ